MFKAYLVGNPYRKCLWENLVGNSCGKISYYYQFIAGSLEAAYSLNGGAREIWGKGGGETLALL